MRTRIYFYLAFLGLSLGLDDYCGYDTLFCLAILGLSLGLDSGDQGNLSYLAFLGLSLGLDSGDHDKLESSTPSWVLNCLNYNKNLINVHESFDGISYLLSSKFEQI